MKELKIGRILVEHRRRRNITQEELAEYIGVSKASVSKWETATTYPDITLLPQLATFFSISIDELVGYEPQMTKTDIRKLYTQISHDFSKKPFHEVMEYCREITKKYFSCAPLLFQIGCLYVNHCSFAKTPPETLAVLEEAIDLFIRVKEESDQVYLINQAVNMEAFCLLKLGREQEVIELLSGSTSLRMASEPLLSQSYKMAGDVEKAKQILQAGIYQLTIELLNLLLPYMELCEKDDGLFEEICRRTLAITKIFHLETLHPSVLLTVYFSIAHNFYRRGNKEKTLDMLEKYTELALSGIYPLRLHGDSFFTLLDDWLEENLPLGSQLPKEEAVIRKNITEALTDTGLFAGLSDDARFQKIIHTLKNEEELRL